MNNVKLYLNNKLADLSDGNSVILNYKRTDYTNPTIVRNSFSKTITLPGTPNNNNLFNSIFKLDYNQVSSTFNPSRRVDFKLTDSEDTVLESGYFKLNYIHRAEEYNTYEITLYGGLGDILYALTYDEDPISYEQTTINLSNLDFNDFGAAGDDLTFTINKNTINSAWSRLDAETTTPSLYDTLNFCVSYNGIPKIDGFDTKTVLVRPSEWTTTEYIYDGVHRLGLPYATTVDDVVYTTVNGWAAIEAPKELTDLEARDLRSYLQRPVLRLSKVFDAIGRYLYTKKGYTLVKEGSFWGKDEYVNAWITLSRLDELVENIQSGVTITQDELLSNTSTPASYLISYCKTYGIYIDVDSIMKTVTLRRSTDFFKAEVYDLEVNLNKEFKITPLSFDKNNYTFDYGEGEGENYTKYKDTYNIQYGSQRVNTGYNFDYETAKYIDSNTFREAVDSLEQSGYFKYDERQFAVLSTIDAAHAYSGVKYILYNTNVEEVASKNLYTVSYYVNAGHWTANLDWGGMNVALYQDGFPKVQFHTKDNSPANGKDVLLIYSGKVVNESAMYNRQTGKWIHKDYFNYIISDDIEESKKYTEKNCYINTYNSSYCIPIGSLPMFTRNKYDLTDLAESNYSIDTSLEFGYTRELYVPATVYSEDSTIYDRYWDNFISDIYSVDTRVVECYIHILDPLTAFRVFYWFENTFWIISELSEFSRDNYWSKAKLIKVNDIYNYTADRSAVYYKITVGNITGPGSVSGAPAVVEEGDSAVVRFNPSTGYTLSSLTDNGTDVTSSVVNNTYTITNISINHQLDVAYGVEVNYTLTINATPDTATISFD